MRSASELFQELTQLGNVVSLEPLVDHLDLNRELEPFASDWKPYNPAKGNFHRWGLAVTSLDGGLSGDPDLTSLREYNKIHGTQLDEMSFCELTPVYKACPSMHALVDPFLPFLGRSHFLKFGTGGFFPYHRDGVGATKSQTFRIFVPLYLRSARDFVFLLGNDRIHLERSRAYFINTYMEHAVISLDEDSVHLVLNVRICAESVATLQKMLFSF